VRRGDVARLVGLAAIWGASFVFIRVVAAPLGPWWTATGRVLLAGVVLAGWLALSRQPARFAQRWRTYLFVGVVSSAMPFVLYAHAALTLPASYMVVLNAMTPLFAAVLAAAFLGERLTAIKLVGIALGVAGVVLVSGAGTIALGGPVVAAIGACVAATLCYAIGGVWMKRHAADLPPSAVAAWSQLLAGLVLLPVALRSPPPGPLTATVLGNLVALALLSSAVAYLLYFRLIRDIGPTRTLTVTFLMPAFGMLFGTLFLGETLHAAMLAGAALILVGTFAVLRPAGIGARALGVR
jgi:drug/metabolite transporter (DMT)-like permease